MAKLFVVKASMVGFNKQYVNCVKYVDVYPLIRALLEEKMD